MKEKMLALLKSLGIELGDKADELGKGLEEITKVAPTPDKTAPPDPTPTKVDDSEKDKTILALTQQIKDLTELVGDMKKNSDASVAAQKEKLEEVRIQKIADLKKKGIDAGKITEANWEKKFKAIAEKDVDSFETILEDLAVDPHFKPAKDPDKKEDQYGGESYVGPLKGADASIMDSINKMSQ